jgi:uncharacterized protein YjdB
MPVGMRKILDKYFLPCFYGLCMIGVVAAIFLFMNVKKQQKEALLAYEKNLNFQGTDEVLRLESNENFSNEQLLYSSSDESIIKVDKSGNLISVGEGSAVLTITTKDQKQTQALVVNVGPEAISEYLKKNPKDNKETVKSKPVDKSLPEVNDEELNKVIPTSITLNKNDVTLNLNSKSKTVALKATIEPSNTTDKEIIWTSSNNDIATVVNGVVTAKKPGTTTITATTNDNVVAATATITVNKKIIIIVGASQVTRMADYKQNYSSKTNNYKVLDKSLVYVNKSGSGIEYQTTEGFTQVKKVVAEYEKSKSTTTFEIFFPLSGNTIKDFSCEEISNTNEKIKQYALNYNNAILELKNMGYQVNGYVVSMHPVKVSQATNKKVVTNENKNACTKEYRSNYKYFQFNKAMKSIVDSNYTANLTYEPIFMKIMETNNNRKNFTYKIIYNTTDGIHWDKDTTSKYVDMMLDYSKNL